ncbi:MAG: hypothetical protein IPL33_18740 [Sphingobacteriales bacterium]|jgi:hypothetical protein|nr:hypothetical protein [Sphingobacteriales bacterium]MCC7224732.1 hypothetical protein [Chitinophagales bacterium]
MRLAYLITFFGATISVLTLNSCTGDGACDAGTELVTHMVNIPAGDGLKPFNYPFSNETVVYYYYSPGGSKVQFFSGYNRINVCTKKHLKIEYTVVPSDSIQPLPMKIFGEAYWSAFTDDLILVDGTITPGPHYYKGDLEIGLKQAFGDGPGDIDFYLNVEFDSQGSFSADSLYFKNHISLMTIEFKVDDYL